MRKPFEYVNHINAVKADEIVYLPLNNKMILYTNNLEKLSEIVIEDEILNFHIIKKEEAKENDIVVIGKTNKKITLMSNKGEKINEFLHSKKITTSVLVVENKVNYLLFSDKFGEIYIKNLDIIFSEVPTILYGHSDPIHMMKISPFNNILVSADTFGKIKVCEFPNIFNLLSVFLYKNEDIKFCDFLSNRELLVLNSEQKLNVWSLEDFQMKNTIDLLTILENETDIISLIPFKQNFLYIETGKFYFILQEEDNNFTIREKIEKNNEKVTKSFLISNANSVIYKIVGVDAEGNIQNIEDRKI